jgi:VCBS repeat-containing protein
MFGSFTFTNGVWTYTLNNNAANVQALGADNTVHDTLLVQSKDGTASQEINVLITGESNGISATNTQGFESGTFNGWNVLGSAEVVTEHDAFLPANGNYFAVLNGNGASAASMESFLGLSPGKLNSLGNGAATSGSVIKTTVNLSAGDVLSFDWAFQAHDYLPFDDFSFLVTGAGQILELADVKNTGNYGFSGWHNFKYTANANTVFELGIGATNVLDNALDSHLLIDNFFII